MTGHRVALPTSNRAEAEIASKRSYQRSRSSWRPGWLDRRLSLLVPLGLFLFSALVLPWPYDGSATAQDLRARLSPPIFLDGGTWAHPFGTDSLGRDVLARTLSGMSLSLQIGLISALGAAAIGIALGLLAAAGSRPLDAAVTMLADVTLTVPFVVVGIVVTAIFGQGLTNVILVLILSGWVGYARVVRLRARSIASSDYVLAARAIGGDQLHVAWVHMLPNLAPVLVLLLCQQVAAMMLYEASLTYLGIGMPIERVSLGGLVQAGQEQIFTAWWIAFAPGLALALAVVGLNLAAEWLQGWLDAHDG